MTTEPLLAGGRDADVFAAGPRLVRRRYRDGSDPCAEAELMRHVARHGYPVPGIDRVEGSDMLMERLDGPTMAEALGGGTLAVAAGAEILADLHDRLHRIAAPGGDGTVVHLDLHPENVMLTEDGPVVIDWRTGGAGPADLDIAMTALILAQVAVDPRDPRAGLVPPFLEKFLNRVAGDATRLLDVALVRRREDPNMSTLELDRMSEAGSLVARCVGQPG